MMSLTSTTVEVIASRESEVVGQVAGQVNSTIIVKVHHTSIACS